MKSPKTLQHPSFGPCELIPSVIAVKWAAPTKETAAKAVLSDFSLKPASEASEPRGSARTREASDPTAAMVNHSETLTWASGTRLSEATLDRLAADSRVEWISAVYKAKGGDGGVRSYFTVNPTTLVLSSDAAAALGDLSQINGEVAIDEARTQVMKGFVALKLPERNAIELAGRLEKSPVLKDIKKGIKLENIPYISPNCACGCGGNGSQAGTSGKCAPATGAHIPNDTFFAQQWGLQRINAPSAWPITKGDPNIVIAVLDQGVDLAHPDLNLWPISYSTITHTNDGSPVGNHGTPCAGIISSRMDNGLGAAGLANDCRVMAIATNFADTEVADGLFYAADNGARVVSMSFGVYSSWMVWDFSIIEAALQYCQDKNVILVAASGNENIAVSRFPGSDPRTLCVGGSNRNDERKRIGDTSGEFWGACFGPSLDVVAPCLQIPTTDRLGAAGYNGTDYTLFFNGTSSATPHVAALAGLILSVNPSLSHTEVRQIISETTDKINPATYTYLATPGKPHGTWNAEVGYGRINAERAVLAACSRANGHKNGEACSVHVGEPEPCCVSQCDPPWRPDEQCMVSYEEKLFRVPIGRDQPILVAALPVRTNYIEFRVTYEHRLCLLGKQHGPLVFTTTLLPGETVNLYHSDRYRRITSVQERYSVQTTFMQFLSVVHQARVSGSVDALNERLTSTKVSGGSSVSGGFFGGLFGVAGSSSSSASAAVTSHTMLSAHVASEQFEQSVRQASQLTHAERSIVVSTYEEKDVTNITVRSIHNANECRAVTYFVRQVVELYAISTRVADISYRIVAQNVPAEWRRIDDVAWLPTAIRDQIKAALALLPKVGQVIMMPRPISIPTDGVVYHPELARCCSAEPERMAAIMVRLEKEKAAALEACVRARERELELERRKMLLQKGDLSRFETVPLLPERAPSELIVARRNGDSQPLVESSRALREEAISAPSNA